MSCQPTTPPHLRHTCRFNTIGVSDGISLGTDGMSFSLQSREIIADSIETVMGAQWYDANISLPGCDKNMPGTIIAMARLNRPSIMIYGGTIKPGYSKWVPSAADDMGGCCCAIIWGLLLCYHGTALWLVAAGHMAMLWALGMSMCTVLMVACAALEARVVCTSCIVAIMGPQSARGDRWRSTSPPACCPAVLLLTRLT
jgi:hypothetical protein